VQHGAAAALYVEALDSQEDSLSRLIGVGRFSPQRDIRSSHTVLAQHEQGGSVSGGKRVRANDCGRDARAARA
jgi:hypothetical protein